MLEMKRRIFYSLENCLDERTQGWVARLSSTIDGVLLGFLKLDEQVYDDKDLVYFHLMFESALKLVLLGFWDVGFEDEGRKVGFCRGF